MNRSFPSRILAPLLLAAAIGACESLTELRQRQPLAAELRGAFVKPTAVQTDGEGSVAGTLSSLNGVASLEYSASFSGLTGDATAMHLHGPASEDEAAPVLVDLAAVPAGSSGQLTLGGTAGSASGTLDLTMAITAAVTGDSLHRLLDAGLVYVDIHTSTQADGEVRGQLRKH